MKKIIADKEEGVAEIIDRILNEPDTDIVLVVPKNSALGKSVRNFNLLKREFEGAGKSVVIESVDETILAFAKQAEIEASHPLWRSVRGAGGFSDIVPSEGAANREVREERIEKSEEPPKKGRSKKDDQKNPPIKLAIPAEEVVVEEEEEEVVIHEHDDRPRGYGSSIRDEDDAPRTASKMWWIIIGILIAIGIVLYVITAFFNRADVSINFKQNPWTYQANFVADKSVSTINPTGNVIPAQIFTSTKNITEMFPASSVQNVSVKSQGTITVYNDYSSAPQELVATTRFLTPDGKIFRLVNTITVPGANVSNGTITPSSIDAPIVADQPGSDYNVGPIAKLTIPGFQSDSGRYTGFYGAITASTTGGFVGKTSVPTAADVAAAKASTTAILQSGLTSSFTTNYPNNFKILDGATTYQITKMLVNTSTDSNGNFSVFGEADMQAIGFDESALTAYLLSLAQSTQANSVFSSIDLNYSSVQANFTAGQVHFALTAQAELEPAFSPDTFGASIAGKSIGDARNMILALPDLADGKISVWPLWLWNIPSDQNKVHVTAQ